MEDVQQAETERDATVDLQVQARVRHGARDTGHGTRDTGHGRGDDRKRRRTAGQRRLQRPMRRDVHLHDRGCGGDEWVRRERGRGGREEGGGRREEEGGRREGEGEGSGKTGRRSATAAGGRTGGNRHKGGLAGLDWTGTRRLRLRLRLRRLHTTTTTTTTGNGERRKGRSVTKIG